MKITPIELLLRVSAASVGATEVPPNTNAGPYVERVLATVGLKKGNPWCAAQVYDWGRIALGKKWPLPATGGCAVLGDFAKKKKILRTTPEVGDVFLIYHPELGRFAHTGLIRSVEPNGAFGTREGNTSGAGSREGWLAADRVRTFKQADRFIRWVELVTDD